MTENHEYNTPEKGTTDWHVPLNENFEKLDADVEIRDAASNLDQYSPESGAKFFATDSKEVYLGDGDQWSMSHRQGGGLSDLLNGEIVYNSQGTGRQTLDPSSSSSPIQDIMDDIEENTSWGGGTVYLPLGTIREDGPIRPTRGVNVIGQARGRTGEQTRIRITGDGNDAFLFDHIGMVQGHFENFLIDMRRDGRNATGTAAIHYAGGGQTHLVSWNNISFMNGEGPVIESDGATFETYHNMLRIDDYDCGDWAVIDWANKGAANHWDLIACYTDDAETGQMSDFFAGRGLHRFGTINLGGSPDRLITGDVQFTLDLANYEPDPEFQSDAGASNTIFEIGGEGAQIGYVQIYNGSFTDHYVVLERGVDNFLENMNISSPSLRSGGGFTSSDLIDVQDNPTGPITYHGDSTDVVNNSGGTLSHQISCLGDLTGVS